MIVREALQLGVADSTFCQIASGCLHNEVRRTAVGEKKNRERGVVSFVNAETDTALPLSEEQQEPQLIGGRR